MFGFTPQASHMGSIGSHIAQLQAMGQQPAAMQPMVDGSQPQSQPQPQTPGGAPGAAQPPGQDPVSQAYHWLTNQFGGAQAGASSAAPAAGGSTAMTPDAVNTAMAGGGSGGSAEVMKYLASMFGL